MLFAIISAFLFTYVAGSKILVVVPVPATSHVMLFEPLAIGLAQKGHEVTFVTPRKLAKPVPNVREIVVPTAMTDPDGKETNFLSAKNMTALDSLLGFPMIGVQVSQQILDNQKFQDFLREKPKFDLLVHEAFVSEGLTAGLARYFNVPFIGYATFMPSGWTHYMVGNIAPTSLLPEPFTGNPYPMNFWQRTTNFLYATAADLHHHLWYMPIQDGILRKYFGNDHPYVSDIIRNMSVLLINDHLSTSFPRPSVPNMVGIAGLHVAKPKPLPQDLQKFLDNSKNGAILFSLGSNVKAHMMPKEKVDVFLNTFAKLEQNVLWKFEKELPNVPKNVLISKWLPQSDILAHPNLNLFMTHGGLLSTTEAIDRATPIVGFPIFGDQHVNMVNAERNGLGVTLDYDTVTEESLYAALQEVLNNPKYTIATQKRSATFHDRVLPPLELAIWWIEYVIRHNGADHLRSGVQDLHWFQLYQLDVVAFLLASLYIALKIVKTVLCSIGSLFCGSKTKNVTKKNN